MADRFTFEDLRDLLVQHGGVPASMIRNEPDLSLEALGIGSMALLAIQLDLSQRGIRLGQEDLPHLATVGGFLDFVNRQKA
jgi:acyl carrier protein